MLDIMNKLVSLCKRRGFIFPGSEIYGGLAGTWDYGPLGALMKQNLKAAWWRRMVQERDDVVGLDAAILMNRQTWEASGHVKFMTDALVECIYCHHRFRQDKVGEKCPDCKKGAFTDPKPFNLMLQTSLGPVADSASGTFLRPETAQGIFVNFHSVQQSSRAKLPFGIAQIGKAFRNEITPGNFTFRTREFEQMELEYFVKPGTDKKWLEYWRDERFQWYQDIGFKKKNIRLRDYKKDELSHYSSATTDIEYAFPFAKDGWDEIEGVANRTDFDLSGHQKASKQDLRYFDEETKERITPYVIEPSAGVDRIVLALLIDAYEEVEGGRSTTTEATKDIEVVLRLHPTIAPIKVAVLPLSKKEPLTKLAASIAADLRKRWMIQYDDVSSIGRRYRRQDEIGTPYCVTVDFESLDDNKVTVRDRDNMKQERVAIQELVGYLQSKF